MPSPRQRPCGDGRSPSGTMPPSCPGAPVPWERGFGGDADRQEVRMSGGACSRGGGWGGTTPQPMPAHPTCAGWA